MHKALLVLAKALIYETCNGEDDDGKCIYLYDVPQHLEFYLREFAPSDCSVTITDGPTVLTCHGFGYGLHCFLEAHGATKCASCKVILCHYCVMKKS